LEPVISDPLAILHRTLSYCIAAYLAQILARRAAEFNASERAARVGWMCGAGFAQGDCEQNGKRAAFPCGSAA